MGWSLDITYPPTYTSNEKTAVATVLSGITYADEGNYLFVGDANDGIVRRYALTTPYDVSTMGSSDQSIDILTITGQNPVHIDFDSLGTRLMVDIGLGVIKTFNLVTPYDITAYYGSLVAGVPTGGSSYSDGCWNRDGTIFFSLTTDGLLRKATTPAAYEVALLVDSGSTFSVTTEIAGEHSMVLSDDGTKIWILSANDSLIQQYTMSTAWDHTSCSASGSFTDARVTAFTRFMRISTDGSKMLLATNTEIAYEYTIGLPGSAEFPLLTDLSAIIDASNAHSTNIVGTVIGEMMWAPGGTRLYSYDDTATRYYQHELTTGYDLTTTQVNDGNRWIGDAYTSADFSPDGKYFIYVYGTTMRIHLVGTDQWDVLPAFGTNTQYNFSGVTPTGIVFSPDGKSFIVSERTTQTLHSYTLSTAWDATSAATNDTLDCTSILSNGVYEDIVIMPGGLHIGVLDSSNNKLWALDLSTAWELTGASVVGSYTDSFFTSKTLTGMALSPDARYITFVNDTDNELVNYAPDTSVDGTLTSTLTGITSTITGGQFPKGDILATLTGITSSIDGYFPVQAGLADEGLDIGDLAEDTLDIIKHGTLIETVNFNDVILSDVLNSILERILLLDTASGNVISSRSITEALLIGEAAAILLEALASEGIDFNDTTNIGLAVLAIEAIALNDVIVSTILATVSLIELVAVTDALYRFNEATLTEGMSFSDVLLDSLIATYLTAEAIELTDTLVNSLSLILPIVEGIDVDDEITTSITAQALLDEGVVFATQFVHDGTMYTGWIMNSENFAVTNYNNYDFTSFGKLNNKYYGIKPEGLYLLEGDMDDTDFITATLKTAAMDFGTSNLKAVPQAYFGFTGDGNMILKLKVDDDTEAWYDMASTADGLHSQRLKLSKGLEGRYWQFELVTQDNTTLELDTIELYPIVLKRKL